MHGGNGSDIDCMERRAVELQSSWTEAMPELARQLVDRLDDHYIERTVTGVLQQALVAGTQCRRARVSCRSNLDSCVPE